jgi:UDP-N-acetylglucosamine transferase subunit ALG13
MRTRKNLTQTQEQMTTLIISLETTLMDEQQIADSQALSFKKRANHVYDFTKDEELKKLIDDYSCVFEWSDGILVESMQ